MSQVTITSFGYGHGAAPEAHLTLDLRQHFRDPHVDPALREMTAADMPVRAVVGATPGIWDLVDATVAMVRAYLAGPGDAPIRVAVGCVGGRHRSAAVADFVAGLLRANYGGAIELTHRDLHRPVIGR
ncbi:RapZ C-terminal domain-containing protein [Streptantibioticus silvisoli]|uniref:RNase adapter RapZ n=1 Tax=Streptantibioticus silvisoli TaxID=2705255 RepID=A0ABT6W4S2_9ACTN|nr:RNase adapter RapZ [Streptantibioticus silvisoli]MDI5965760.1 RNase adapter RapZ [Streptantibioticus silvisoli]